LLRAALRRATLQTTCGRSDGDGSMTFVLNDDVKEMRIFVSIAAEHACLRIFTKSLITWDLLARQTSAPKQPLVFVRLMAVQMHALSSTA
jgi:hypothetical protein